MNKMLVLVRREYWENRSLWITPLVIAGVLLVIAAFGGVHVGDHGNWSFGSRDDDGEIGRLLAAGLSQRQLIYGMTMAVFTSIQLFVLGIVVFFYLLDSLLAERKDRSILFWKSLPISDSQIVGSKLITALVATPIIVLLVSAVTQLVFGLVWWLRFHGTPLGMALMPFDASVWLQVQVAMWALAFATILWYLPIAGYLLLVSVWSRKNAFLWAVLPPIAVLLIEKLIIGSNHFAEFLGRRFGGVFDLLKLDQHGDDAPSSLGGFLSAVGHVFTSYETWLGVVVAAVFAVAVVRFRRYRDES